MSKAKLLCTFAVALVAVALFGCRAFAVAAPPTPPRGTRSATIQAAEPEKPIPAAQLLEAASCPQRGYQPGDLISASDVEPVLKQLEERWGESLKDVRRKLVRPDDLVRQLRSPSGKAFMRQASRFGQGYDRIDRLSQLPDGQTLLAKLIQGPDGYKLIEYMTTTPAAR